jgi:hypothetical protein
MVAAARNSAHPQKIHSQNASGLIPEAFFLRQKIGAQLRHHPSGPRASLSLKNRR